MTREVRNGQAGITLIEVLAVLLVVGVASGAMVMGFGDRSRSAETEAVRLAQHLLLGVDEALLTGRTLVLRWDRAGYVFGQLPSDQPDSAPETWPAVFQSNLGQRHNLMEPLELISGYGAIPPAMVLPSSGVAPEIVFDIVGGDTTWTVTFDGFTAFAAAEAGR